MQPLPARTGAAYQPRYERVMGMSVSIITVNSS